MSGKTFFLQWIVCYISELIWRYIETLDILFKMMIFITNLIFNQVCLSVVVKYEVRPTIVIALLSFYVHFAAVIS